MLMKTSETTRRNTRDGGVDELLLRLRTSVSTPLFRFVVRLSGAALRHSKSRLHP
jgi:hypothetical protein